MGTQTTTANGGFMFSINFIRAKIALILVMIVWGSLIAKDLLRMVFAFFYDKNNKDVQMLRNTLLTQDYYSNVILGGQHHTYISGLLGHFKLTGSRSGTICANIVDWLFEKLTGEVNHCINAMDENDVYNFSARRALAGFVLYISSLAMSYYAVTFILLTFINWG